MNEKINQISSKSRETILQNIKQKYKANDFKYIDTIDPVIHIKRDALEDSLSEMKRKMTDNKFIVEECNKDQLEDKINEIVLNYNYKKMIYGIGLKLNISKIKADEKICFDREIEDLRSEVFHSDFSIIHAKYGISTHGVVCVLSSKEQPRMLSLAPTLCIILLEKEKVLNSLSEALNLVKKENETLPNNILFIAGPSRTADIELITVFGVHGPQKVHLILY